MNGMDEGIQEERAVRNRMKRRKQARLMAALASLAATVVVVCIAAIICDWVRMKTDKENIAATGGNAVDGTEETEDGIRLIDIDSEGNLVDEEGDIIGVLSGSVLYSQEELEEKLAVAREQAAEDLLDDIRTGLNEGDSILKTLRPLYPEYMIVHSSGKYNFVPINRSLRQSQLKDEFLNILDTGEYQYLQDGEVISHKGIDVSVYQENIDWELVAQDGVEFVFVRVGYRGYGTAGRMMEDENFDVNVSGALAAGLKVGVYYYSQAITEEEALEEANFVLEKIKPYEITCPVVYDVERVSDASGRMNKLSAEERTNMALTFCQAIENAGYKPMIYHNTEMGALMLNLEAIEGYDKWFAAYSDTFYYPYEYSVWQYSQSGTVQGIKRAVDLNISFGPLWEE